MKIKNVTQNCNRRALLGALATLPASGALAFAGPVPEQPAPVTLPDWWEKKTAAVDPHHDWLVEWRKLRDEINDTFPDLDAQIFAAEEKLERNILTTPAKTRAGIAAQIRFGLEFEVCGGQLGGIFDGLDTNMFKGIAEALET